MIIKIFLGLASGAILIFACYIGFSQDKPQTVAVLCAAAFLFLFFAFLSRFKKIKGFGLEAELWEQVQHDAETMIRELRQLALITAAPVTRLSATIGYFDSHYENNELHKLIMLIEKSLIKNGISKDEIESIKQPFHRRVVRSLYTPITKAISKKLNDKFDAASVEISKRHPQPIQDTAVYNREIAESREI